jgi:hypothetical protein
MVDKIFFYKFLKVLWDFTYFWWDHHFGLKSLPLFRCRVYLRVKFSRFHQIVFGCEDIELFLLLKSFSIIIYIFFEVLFPSKKLLFVC